MKIRTRFVSNSSSASFVIVWQPYNAQDDIRENLKLLFAFADVSTECYDDVIAHTIQEGELYKTSFGTSMFNGIDDFGEAAVKLLAGVAMYDSLIKTKLKNLPNM